MQPPLSMLGHEPRWNLLLSMHTALYQQAINLGLCVYCYFLLGHEPYWELLLFMLFALYQQAFDFGLCVYCYVMLGHELCWNLLLFMLHFGIISASDQYRPVSIAISDDDFAPLTSICRYLMHPFYARLSLDSDYATSSLFALH